MPRVYMGSWLLVLVRKFYKINQNLKKYKPIPYHLFSGNTKKPVDQIDLIKHIFCPGLTLVNYMHRFNPY